MERETFDEAIALDKLIRNLQESIKKVEESHKIIFSSGHNSFLITPGDFGFKDAKEAVIKKLNDEKTYFEKTFNEL